MTDTHKGACFCGAVELEVKGAPEAMGYCHCRSCRSWSGGPVNAFSLWKPKAVRITRGAEHVATFQKTEISQRQYWIFFGRPLVCRIAPLAPRIDTSNNGPDAGDALSLKIQGNAYAAAFVRAGTIDKNITVTSQLVSALD